MSSMREIGPKSTFAAPGRGRAAFSTMTVVFAVLTAAIATFAAGQVHAQTSDVQATVPGAPRNLEVTVSAQDSENLSVSWEAPASDGGSAITGYKIQYKLSDGATFDHELAVSSDLAGLPRRVAQVTNGSGREHTVRVVATNAAGDGPHSVEVTATPLTPVGHLRAFVEKDIVQKYGAAHPWLRAAWEHMNRPGFNLQVYRHPGGHSGFVVPNCGVYVDRLWSCSVDNMAIDPDSTTSAAVITHEMAHVYTLTNGLASNPSPLGAAHVYFNRLNLGSSCPANELYADILKMTVLPNDRMSYWGPCNGGNAARTQEALAVVRSALRGEMPAWFGTTYGNSDPDLEQFWAHVKEVSSRRNAVTYQLRNAFGGYCENRTATSSAKGYGPVRNPWRDGGCVPQEPGSVAVNAIGNGNLSVYWSAPVNDGGSPVEGYKVQWKSGSQDYDRSRQVRISDPDDRLHVIEGLNSGTEYTVRVVAYNEHGDGALTGEVSATPSVGDSTAPTLTMARVAGSTLTLNWSEPLDTNSVPATSAFTVTVNGTRRGIAGIAVAGGGVILTLATAAKTTDVLTVSYSPPSQASVKAIQDVAQNKAAAFSGRAVTNETVIEVASITISSDPGADGIYTYGSASGRTPETIEATVTFSENVTVTGTPELPVKLQVGVGVPPGTPGQDVGRPSLVYHSGSGTASLTFRRVVKQGDSNRDGIRIWAGEIELNRGTIRGVSGRNAVLTHEGLAAQSGHRVDGVQPTLWGATRSIYDVLTAVGGSAAVDGNTITLLYNEALDETKVPTPGYGFEVWVGGTRGGTYVNGGTAQSVTAVAMNGRRVTLTLTSPVAPDADVRIDYVVPYYRHSAAITDSAGNQARNFYSDVIDNVTAASGAASVDALALASSPGADRTYTIGDEIDVRVTYSTSVTVDTASGTPTLNIGVGSAIRPAAYIAGSGTQELTFRYTVAEDDVDSDGVSIPSGHIAVNGGMIGSGSPRVAAARTHSGLAVQSGHLVDGERPSPLSGSVDGTTLTLNWNEPLDSNSVPSAYQFPIYVNGRSRGSRAIDTVAVSGSTVTLTLSSAVAPGDTVGVNYEAKTLADLTPVRDVPGNAAAKLGNSAVGNIGMTVTNETAGLPAVSIAPSTTPVTEGTAAAFTLSRTGATDAELTVEVSVSESEAAVSGTPPTQVTFAAGSASAALSVATEDDEAVEDASTVTATVSSGTGYTVSGTSGSADVVVEDDDAAPVVTTASPIEAAENGTAVATLSATDEDTAAGDLTWSIPSGAAGGADGAKFALTAGGELTFQATKDFESPDDADADGEYEVTVRVTDGSNPVDAALVVRLSDVDDTAPTLSSATADGDALTLTFSEALDGDSVPPASSFAVTVAGSTRRVDAVAVSEKAVTLTLSSAVVSGETVTVGYAVPTGVDAKPVKDAAGNSVATFANAEVTNEMTALPVVSIAASTTPVTEGTAAAFTLSRTGATDAELTAAVSVAESEAALSGTPSTQVTFAAGSASATLSVTTQDDEAVEDASTVTATVSPGTGYTVSGISGSADIVVEDDDAAPVVTTASPIEVAENATAVATLAATDEDTAAGELSWSIPSGADGGADGAKFALTAGGELTFKATKDYESPDDADTDGAYEVTVRVTDGSNPVDAALVVRLSDVDDTAPSVTELAMIHSPRSGAYGIGSAIDVLVTYSADVITDRTNGTPTLNIQVGSTIRRAALNNANNGRGGQRLVFRYRPVVEGEEDLDGVSVPSGYIALNGGTIVAESTGVAAVRTHSGLAAQDGHLVETQRPTLSSATVDGDALTLTFSEVLADDWLPPVTAFAVTVAGSARTVDAVAVSESMVTLTLSSAVTSGETVTVGYTLLGGAFAHRVLRDAAGNPAANFADVDVTNETAGLPAVSIAASTTPVTEGTAAAFTLARTGATDAELTVEVSVAESGAALNGTPPAQVTFAAGSASAALSVATGDDEAVEDASTVTATVSSGTGYTVSGSSGSAEVVVEDDDASPVVTTASPIEVAENATAVATLAATDEDTAGEDLSWSIPSGADGGADGAKFALTTVGELTFGSAKDYEAPDDADTDGEYEVTVRVTDGSNPVDAALVVRLSDVDDTAPTLSSATVDGDALTLTLDEALDEDSVPPESSFAVTVAGSARTVDVVAVSEKVVTLTLSSAVVSGEAVTVGYTVPTGADATPVKDAAGNPAATFANAEVTNETAALPVVSIAASTTPVTEGTAAAFTLTRTGATDAELTVEVSVTESEAAVSGTPPTQATFAAGSASATLSVATEDDEAVEDASTVTATVSSGTGYTVSGTSGSADVVVEDDDAAPVVTTASPIEVAENGTAVATLTATDEDTAAEDLVWSIPSGADGGADGAKFALTTGGELTFGSAKDYEAPDDADTDGEYEVTVRVTDGSNPVDAALVVRLSDVDDTAPTLSSATVDGDELTLTFSEALDGDAEPAASTFAVTVAGSARTVDAVSVSEKVVTLTLSSAVVSGETVTVGYTVPTGADAKPVKDAAGNSVATFANAEVTNETAALPVVSIAASTTPVTEGTAASFTLTRTEATDAELTVEVSVAESGAALSGTPPTEATFAAGSASATLSVATDDDEVVEDASTVTATVSSATGYTVSGTSGSADVVVEDDDAAPVVTTASPIEVAENGTAVATLAATDEDTAAEDLTWSIPTGADGGADGSEFALTAGGELTFGSAKDFEAPDDADTDGEYEVTVRVTDGSNPVDTALVVRLSDVRPTASFEQVPERHDGTAAFRFQLHFSPEPAGLSYKTVGGGLLEVIGATVNGARRLTKGSNLAWEVTAEPTQMDDIVISLPVRPCSENSAICIDGEPLARAASATVPGPAVVSILASATPVTEGTDAAFTLTRTGATDAELTVEVSVTESEAAVSGTPPTQATFAAGSASATLSVATEDDEAVEDASTVTATVSSGTGYTVSGTSGSADVVVEDDDAAPVVTTASPIEVAENGTAVATLTATDEDTAAEDLVWSIPSGADGGADGAKFALTTGGELTFGSAKDYEAPDDADTDGEYEVTVRVTDGSNPVDAALVVRLSDVDDTAPTLSSATVDGDELTLTFSEALDGDAEPAASTFAVTVAGSARTVDAVSVSEKVVTLTLSSAVVSGETVTVGYTVPTGADAKPVKDAAGNSVATFANAEVTNETAALPVVSIAASTTPVTEGTAASFTLTRTEATDAELTVEVSVAESGAALSGTPPTEATFAAGSASATLSVATDDDEVVEDASTVTATVSSATGYTVSGTSGSADVVVEDDDAAPVVTTASPIEVAENGTAVATLAATDEDTAAEDLTWSIPTGADGGADGSEFALTAGGELTFGSAKDFEAPDDADTDGEYEVTVRVTDGSNPVDTALVVRLSDVDDTAPTLSSTSVDGDVLTLTFNETLDGDSVPPESSFAVTVTHGPRTVDALIRSDKGATRVGRTAHNVNEVTVSGKMVMLTLSSAVVSGETVTVGYTAPTGADAKPVKDAAGNPAPTFSNAEVKNETAALPVVSIASTTTPVTEGTAAAFTLSRTEATDAELTVEVSVSESGATLSGTPPTQVTFAAGSANAALSVATEDDEAVEDASTVTATVSSATGYTVDEASGSADVVVEDDDAAPVVTTASPIEVVENGTAVATLAASDEDTAAEDLTWSIPAGADGGADGSKFALTTGGELTFGSAKDFEAPDDADTDGEYEVTVRVTDGSNPVDAALMVRLSDVDDMPPTVTGVSVTSDPGADRRWENGDRIEIEVQFSEAVTVDVSGGTPTLKFWTYGVAHRAAYSSGSGTSTLTFDWEVSREGTRGGSPSRAMVAENGLKLRGATIRNEAGVDAELGFTVTPMITSVRIAGPTSPNRWAPGEMVSVSLAFSAVVTVDTDGGLPTLGLQLVAGARNATYAAGSGTRSLTFAYPVTDSDGDVRLVRVLSNALSRNGGTIKNKAGEDAALSYRGNGRITAPDAIGIAIDDARAVEGVDETITFRVRFAPARNQTVSVSWATEDGTATAGEDYSASQGTVSFAPGETEKTIEVAILNDAHDEGEETFTVRLSDASPAYLAAGGRITRATATGTIVNTDAMPRAWLARFGRTVAEQVIEAVEGRFDAPRTPGTEVTLAGQALRGTSAEEVEALEEREAEARLEALSRWLTGDDDETDEETAHSRALTGRDFLYGTSFALTGGTAEGGFASVWGRGAVSHFDGRDGDLTLNGEIESAMLGADFTRETTAVGLMVMHSRGEGSYRGQGEGNVDSSLTGLYPYGRYALNERVTVWGAAGYGEGKLTLTPKDAPPIETDMDLTMGVVGVRGVALEAPADGGIELSVTSDAMAVRTSSEEVSGGEGGKLAGTDGDVTRLRLGLEGTWRGLATGPSGELTPRLELGLRHDGGDAETGFGVDAGAGLIWVHPASGLSAELSARGLLTHESDGFRDRGIAGSLAWDPRPDSDRGLSLTVSQTMGVAAAGGMDALLGRETLEGLASNDEGDDLANRRLDVGLGYGFGVFGDRFTAMPEVGLGLSNGRREYRLGWRLGLQRGGPVSMELGLDAMRHEAANDEGEAVNLLMLRGSVRW